MPRYDLFLLVEGQWKWFANIDVTSNAEAYERALPLIPKEHRNKPLSLRCLPANDDWHSGSSGGPPPN